MKGKLVVLLFALLLSAIPLVGCFLFPANGYLAIVPTEWPDGLVSVLVTVSGPDMDPVEATFTSSTATGTADIVAGEQAAIQISGADLLVTGTKLVVIDWWTDRIVQVDDVSGAGWQELSVLDLGYCCLIDLEIGPDGKIYATDGEHMDVFSIDSIADTVATTMFDHPFVSPAQLGIDHANRLIYFSDSTSVYSIPIGGGPTIDYATRLDPFIAHRGGAIRGLTAGDDGIAYVLYAIGFDRLSVLALDPSGSGSVAANADFYDVAQSFAANYRADIVVKGGSLFVALFDETGTSNPIVESDLDLTFLHSFGSLYDGETASPTALCGPAQFVGHRNPEIQFIDDISGNGRSHFGASGTGEY